MNLRAVPALGLLLAVAGCASTQPFSPGELRVSLVHLIAYPERLAAGQRVAVYGFLSAEQPMNSWLFLTEAHAIARDLNSGLAIVANEELGATTCASRFVRVYGLLEDLGGEYAISDVSKIELADREPAAPNEFRLPQVCFASS